jgi:hypothetical protein
LTFIVVHPLEIESGTARNAILCQPGDKLEHARHKKKRQDPISWILPKFTPGAPQTPTLCEAGKNNLYTLTEGVPIIAPIHYHTRPNYYQFK